MEVQLSEWLIYPEANRDSVEDLVARASVQLGMNSPPGLGETSVLFPFPKEQVAAALRAVEPEWTDKGLLYSDED